MKVEPNVLNGLVYGCALAALGFLAAGAGHGTYVLTGASSAPAGLFGIPAAVAGAPVLWASVGAAFDWLSRTWRNRIVAPVLLAHYIGAAVLLTRMPYGDWDYLTRFNGVLWPVVATWTIVYLLGQAAVWRAVIRRAG